MEVNLMNALGIGCHETAEFAEEARSRLRRRMPSMGRPSVGGAEAPLP
jgi:hypothetical protein